MILIMGIQEKIIILLRGSLLSLVGLAWIAVGVLGARILGSGCVVQKFLRNKMKNFKKIKEDNLKTRLQKIADTQRQESKFDGEITVKEEIQNPRIEASTNMNTTETHIIY